MEWLARLVRLVSGWVGGMVTCDPRPPNPEEGFVNSQHFLFSTFRTNRSHPRPGCAGGSRCGVSSESASGPGFQFLIRVDFKAEERTLECPRRWNQANILIQRGMTQVEHSIYE